MPHSRVSELGRTSKESTGECILGVVMVMTPQKFEMEFWNYLLSQKGEEMGEKEPGGSGELFRREAVGNAMSRQVVPVHLSKCMHIQSVTHRLLWMRIVTNTSQNKIQNVVLFIYIYLWLNCSFLQHQFDR